MNKIEGHELFDAWAKAQDLFYQRAEQMVDEANEAELPDCTITDVNGLAKVSATPGKTRTLNFFNVNDELRLVDVPGYGYAKVPERIQQQFGEMFETYCTERKNFKAMCLLVDYRHPPKDDDITMYEYAKYYHIPVIVVATKEDKLKRNDLIKNEKRIKEDLGFDENDYFIRFSSLNKKGVDEVWETILKLCD